MTIKARKYYRTEDRGYGSEIVRVTGFQDVTLGDGRTEKWCRVRHEGNRVAKILMHPTSLREIA